MSTLKNTLQFIRSASMAATIQGHGSKADFLADRIVQASTEATLLAMSERLTKLLGSDAGEIHTVAVTGLVKAAAAPDADQVLAWLRGNPKLAAMVCFLPQEDFVAAASEIALAVETTSADDRAPTRPAFGYQITCELTAPLAHGADIKAGNATLFRRQMVRGVNGGIMQLPFYAGNALRGMLRDILADDLTHLLGFKPNRAKPVYNLWFFHALYAGGALDDGAQTKAANKKLGTSGVLNADGIREFRDMLPGLSLLGCAIGNKIISGRLRVGDLRPRCREWGTGDASTQTLFDWLYLTRRDDHEGRGYEDGHKGMIANTEVLRPGVVLDGGIDYDDHIQDMERAALEHALYVLSMIGYLGAQTRQGYGKCRITVEPSVKKDTWSRWVADNKKRIIAYLHEINALPAEAPAEAESN